MILSPSSFPDHPVTCVVIHFLRIFLRIFLRWVKTSTIHRSFGITTAFRVAIPPTSCTTLSAPFSPTLFFVLGHLLVRTRQRTLITFPFFSSALSHKMFGRTTPKTGVLGMEQLCRQCFFDMVRQFYLTIHTTPDFFDTLFFHPFFRDLVFLQCRSHFHLFYHANGLMKTRPGRTSAVFMLRETFGRIVRLSNVKATVL